MLRNVLLQHARDHGCQRAQSRMVHGRSDRYLRDGLAVVAAGQGRQFAFQVGLVVEELGKRRDVTWSQSEIAQRQTN